MLLPSKGLHHFEWRSLYGEISSRWPFMTNTRLLVLCTNVMYKISQTFSKTYPFRHVIALIIERIFTIIMTCTRRRKPTTNFPLPTWFTQFQTMLALYSQYRISMAWSVGHHHNHYWRTSNC